MYAAFQFINPRPTKPQFFIPDKNLWRDKTMWPGLPLGSSRLHI
jgi:hypothetical protein